MLTSPTDEIEQKKGVKPNPLRNLLGTIFSPLICFLCAIICWYFVIGIYTRKNPYYNMGRVGGGHSYF